MMNQSFKLTWRPARAASLGATALAFGLIATACTSAEADQSATTTPASSATSQTSQQAPQPTEPEPAIEDVIVVGPASGYSNTGAGYLGNPLWGTGPGNIPIGQGGNTELSIRFVARGSGSSTAASYNIKFDSDRPGYQGERCGSLVVSLRPDDGAGNPAADVITSTTIDEPCAGGRDSGWLTNRAWDAPAELVGGQPYHLTFANPQADDNTWVSINLIYRPDDDPDQLAFSTADGELRVLARGSAFWSGNETGDWGQSDTLADHHPAFEVHYADGTSQGNSYIGARWNHEITLSADSPAVLRQTFLVSQDTEITELHFASDPEGTSDDAAARATLSISEGVDLATVDLTRPAGQHWFDAEFATPLFLTADTTYSVTIERTAGTIYVRPLYQAQHDDWQSSDQSDWANTTLEVDQTGSGAWEPYVPQIPHDLSLYFAVPGADQPAPDEPAIDAENASGQTIAQPTVALLGDSLIGGPDFEAQFTTALQARHLDVATLVSESGQDIHELDAALDVETPIADIIVVANSINGEDDGAVFEAGVRSVVTKLRAQNPNATILWVEAHATLAKYDYIVDQRVTPRNAVLAKLDAEGVVEVVGWADIAEANLDIYTESGDGVHFFGSQQLYATSIVQAIETVL